MTVINIFAECQTTPAMTESRLYFSTVHSKYRTFNATVVPLSLFLAFSTCTNRTANPDTQAHPTSSAGGLQTLRKSLVVDSTRKLPSVASGNQVCDIFGILIHTLFVVILGCVQRGNLLVYFRGRRVLDGNPYYFRRKYPGQKPFHGSGNSVRIRKIRRTCT